MLASIIIVSYNGKEELRDCLASVVKTAPADCEIIVVDNASTDGSPAMVAQSFPTVRLIRHTTNAGFGGANNLAAREATGEFLVFLNPDTVVGPGWIEPLLEALRKEERAGLATGKLLRPDNRINTCGNRVHFTGLTLCRGLGSERNTFAESEEVDAVSGALFAMRRQLFETIGGFDETMFLYMEDTDLSWRTRLAGWRCIYTPASVVVHNYELRFSSLKVYYQERNRYLMLLKTLRVATLAVLFPSLLLADVVTWGFVLLRDRCHWRNKLRAYGWILQHRKLVREKRRHAQSLRNIRDHELLAQTVHELEFAQVSTNFSGRFAAATFNPVFRLLRALTLAVVRW
jgi:GT2 family glycosyltransferase